MTTIRRRLTTVVHGGPGRDGGRVRHAAVSRAAPVQPPRARPALGPEADLADHWLSESYNVLGRIVATQGLNRALDPGISAYLEAVRDYLVVVDTTAQVLALSESARTLTAADLELLTAPLDSLRSARESGTLHLGAPAGAVRYFAMRVKQAGPEIGGLLVATSARQIAFGPTELLRSMLFIAPMVLIGSTLIGYWLAGTSLRPVQGIMDEVEAISDGRSLHRRLAVPISGDEMSRLALTVNGMLARLERSFDSLRRFTADASHELKTPLQVLRLGVERALVHPGVPQEILESLDETLAQVNEMTEMVESLLTLARADEGDVPLAMEQHDLRDVPERRRRDGRHAWGGRRRQGDERHAGLAGHAGRGPPADPGNAAQPRHQRGEVHSAGRHRGPRA